MNSQIFHENIFQVIFSFINDGSHYLSILLTCKKWLEVGYKYLDFTINNNEFIRISCDHGVIRTVRRLLQDSRVDPSADDQYAIRSASERGHHLVVETLLKDPRGRAEPCGPSASDPSVDNQYAIKWASKYGHHKVVALLSQHPRVGMIMPHVTS